MRSTKSKTALARITAGVISSAVFLTATSVNPSALNPEPSATVETDSGVSSDPASFDFVIGPVDKIKRDVSFERVVNVEGRPIAVLYQIPESTGLSNVVSWYRGEAARLNADVIFECDARDCGRATIWSSEVFKVRELGATDQRQHYMAISFSTEDGPRVASIYMVQRGNRRIYAYTFEILTDEEIQFDNTNKYSEMLARHGSVTLDSVVPNRYGKLPPPALAELEAIAGQFTTFSSQKLYVVCVLFGHQQTEQLLADSLVCAQEAITKLDIDNGVEYIPFGAGPLFPNQGKPQSRIVVVAPHLLRFE